MKEYLYIRINKQMKEKLQEQAKKEYTTMSGLTKRILKEYLERGK